MWLMWAMLCLLSFSPGQCHAQEARGQILTATARQEIALSSPGRTESEPERSLGEGRDREDETSKEVMKVVDGLFDSMRKRDVAALRAAFIPEGRLVATSVRNNQPTIRIMSLDDFVRAVSETKEPYVERMFDPEARVYGDLATVEGRYDFHVGERLTNCGANAFHLIRTSGGWKIAHIASTIQTKGCKP